MQILLDTHILIWVLSDDKQLPKSWKEQIEKTSNDVIVSAVTVWEMEIKKAAGKISYPENLLEILEQNNIKELPITFSHVMYLNRLPQIHKDPFDRMILAQGICEGLQIATADKNMLKYEADFLKVL